MQSSRMFGCFLISISILVAQQLNHASGLPLPGSGSLDSAHPIKVYDYPQHPNEVLPIEPVLLYPTSRKLQYQGRNLIKDDVIYVKLLNSKGYHPKKFATDAIIVDTDAPRELTIKDIFYVKALTNGQFNPHRLKLYRLPEFYAINVYHSGAIP